MTWCQTVKDHDKMAQDLVLNRILLKLSGEALAGPDGRGLDPGAMSRIGAQIREVVQLGVEVALVIGGGNFFRGLPASRQGADRSEADAIGMLATVMNGLAMRDALETGGLRCRLQSAFEITGVVPPFNARQARQALYDGEVLILAGGTGHPFFTTDTTAALRACQIQAQAILKATKVDGIYSADPHKFPDAVRYSQLEYSEALAQRLGVMDSTAFSLCMDNQVPIVVFNFSEPGALCRIVKGDLTTATIVGSL